MKQVSFARHCFPPDVILQVVWLYFRFPLSFRNIEDFMAQRGIAVSYETIRMWTRKFGQLFAHNLRKSKPAPSVRWHLDEMVVRIGGKRMFLWRAVDDEGEVLDMLVQKRPNKAAALKVFRKLLKNHGVHPETIVADGLASYQLQPTNSGAEAAIALAGFEITIVLRTLICRSAAANANSSASNRKVQPRDFSPRTTAHYNVFNVQRHLISRCTLSYLRAQP